MDLVIRKLRFSAVIDSANFLIIPSAVFNLIVLVKRLEIQQINYLGV